MNTQTTISFDDLISNFFPSVKDVALLTKGLVVSVMPKAIEVVWERQKIVGYGVGLKKMSEHFCAIGLYTHHVNLYFLYGAYLEDPEHILQGNGKSMRHVKLKHPNDVMCPNLKDLLYKSAQYLPKLKDQSLIQRCMTPIGCDD